MDKKDKNPNVPNLRFNEGKYNTYKLKDFSERITRKNKNNKSNLPLTISAQYGLVDQVSFFNKTVASKDMSKYYLLQNGEFAYNKSYSKDYPWGAIKRLDRYDSGCLSTLYICFKCNPKVVNSNYLVHYFESPKWYKQVSDIAGEGARNHGLLNIAVDDFFNTKHRLPSIEVQEKIAIFLDLVENRINTQIKIIDDYTCLKKYIIHQIFSCNNQKVKLINLIKDSTRRNKDNSIKRILSVNNKLGFLKQSEQFEDRTIASSDVSNYKIVYMNQYAYNPARINVGSIARLINYENGIVSPMYIIFNINSNKINHTYFDAFLESICFKNQLRKKLEGSVRQCLTFESLKSMYIPLPEINVQIKYAKTLNELESKIILEKQILEKYQSQKMYLLNNMFI